LVFFFDQGTLWPKPGPFPQMSHTAATGVHFHSIAIWAHLGATEKSYLSASTAD
jgi:hypothetical protein